MAHYNNNTIHILDLKGNVMNAFRLAVVGACRGPHMFDITELMPRQEVVARIRKAIADIPAPQKD